MRSSVSRRYGWITGLFAVAVTLVSPVLAQDTSAAKTPQTTATFDPKPWLLPLNEEAKVEWAADGDLVVTWNVDSDSTDVTVSTSPDQTGVSQSVKGEKRIEIKGQSKAARPYVHLRFHGGPRNGQTITVAERRLPLSGVANLRDIGGYRTENGKQVRWGCVYRAEALSTLTESDMTYLGKLGLKMVCDFRGVREAAAAPDKLPKSDALSLVSLPIDASSGSHGTAALFGVAMKGDLDAVNNMMAESYISMVDEHAKDVFGVLIADLADRKNLPALYHCTAGKDRTGIATAIILRALGVPEKTVLADYSLTNLAYDSLMVQVRANKQLAAAGISPERLGPLLGANPAWIEKMLRHIDENYGSVEGYLTGPCGVDKATIEKLRANLLQ